MLSRFVLLALLALLSATSGCATLLTQSALDGSSSTDLAAPSAAWVVPDTEAGPSRLVVRFERASHHRGHSVFGCPAPSVSTWTAVYDISDDVLGAPGRPAPVLDAEDLVDGVAPPTSLGLPIQSLPLGADAPQPPEVRLAALRGDLPARCLLAAEDGLWLHDRGRLTPLSRGIERSTPMPLGLVKVASFPITLAIDIAATPVYLVAAAGVVIVDAVD